MGKITQKKQISHENIFTKYNFSADVDSLSDYYNTKTSSSQKSTTISCSTTTLKRGYCKYNRYPLNK